MITNIDPENRYLIAYNQLGDRARSIYADYGDIMQAMPANRGKLAKKMGASVNTVGEVIKFTEVWGGPSNGGLAKARKDAADAGEASCHLIIPDAHFSRKDRINNFLRAKRLGVYIAKVAARCKAKGRPLKVICLGDWWDMISLCFYEKDKASFGLQSVQGDMEAGEVAMAVMMDAFDEHLTSLGVKLTGADIELHFTNGNHEMRLNKALTHTEHGVMLKGTRTHQQIVEDFGWTFHEYMQPAKVDGVAYAHCLPSGVMGRAIGGTNATKSLLDKMMVSCVVGHSHVWDISVRTDAFGGKKFAIAAGCYYDKIPGYAKTTGQMWWRGVTLLNGVRDGNLTRGYSNVTVDDMIDVVGY